MHRRDIAGRIIGLLVFALGILILAFSFYTAYHHLFVSPTAGLSVATPKPGGPSAVNDLSKSALTVIIRLAALFIMVLVGSLIASRGLQMYFASGGTNTSDQSGFGDRPAQAQGP